jgi:hypothetical protein
VSKTDSLLSDGTCVIGELASGLTPLVEVYRRASSTGIPPVRQGSEAALFFGRPETVADKIIRLHGLMQVDRFELHVSSIMQGRCARWSCTALRSLRWSIRSWALDRRSEALTGCDCTQPADCTSQ